MAKLKKLIAEYKSTALLLVGMLAMRAAIADWYVVPTGSMYPSVMIGDRVVANKLAYDIKVPLTDIVLKQVNDPQRGDIVTFISPEDGNRLVKRIVGVPGDVVQMRGEQLTVNGVHAAYGEAQGVTASHLTPDYSGQQLVLSEQLLGNQRSIIVMPERPAMRDFGPVTVPSGQYLMLGDNRDNSKDSRYIGFIKREAITGRVKRVAYSLDTDKFYLPRIDRFGAAL